MNFFVKTLVLFLLLSANLFAQVGPYEWTATIGTSFASHEPYKLLTDGSGNVYVTGKFDQATDFDPGPGTNIVTPITSYDQLFLLKLDSSGAFVWVKTIGGAPGIHPNGLVPLDMDIDNAGNFIITGGYYRTVDFDPGPATNNMTATGISDIFILKLDPSGNFIWVKGMGGNASDGGYGVTTDNSDNIWVTGEFRNVVDFDPGLGVFSLHAVATDNTFYLKLDPNGNFIWAGKTGNLTLEDRGLDMITDADNNIYTTGYYTGTTDFDPGSGVFNLPVGGDDDAFIQKLDSNGNFLWAKSINAAGDQEGVSIDLDSKGNVVVAGTMEGTVDMDPGPGMHFLSGGNESIYLLKLTSNGDFKSAVHFISDGGRNPVAVTVDASDQVYLTGNHNYFTTTDFDPGPAVYSISAFGNFILNLDSANNFIWAQVLARDRFSESVSIAIDPFGSVYTTGHFNGRMDFDPGLFSQDFRNSVGDKDIFIHKLNQDSCSNIAIFIDSTEAVTCSDSGLAIARGFGGVQPYQYSWNTTPVDTDSVATFDVSGIYELTLTDNIGCQTSAKLHVSGPTSIMNFDLNANLIATSFRPGFDAPVWLDAFNDGCLGTAGELKLVMDTSKLIYQNSTITTSAIKGDTLSWSFPNMNYDSTHFQPQLLFTVKTSAMIGDTICMKLIMDPISGDADTVNNIKEYCFPVINGYDPNDKQVYPQGECFNKYVLKNEPLTYTVRFQNTGNADAINIRILDTLSSDLDINTLQVVGTSHTMYTIIQDSNVLDFRFDTIFLPDSTTNNAASQGFVIFEVYPKPGLSDGTVIENFSDIYFDFNPPITTNTVSNTLIDTIPVTRAMDSIVSCDSYTWLDGQNYTSDNNTAQYTMLNTLGCDSILTLDLTILQSTSATDVQQACDSYTWIDGNTYLADTNSAVYKISNNAGCDSVVTLNLTINNSSEATDEQQACFSFEWIDGITYFENNDTTTYVISNLKGCDSLVTLDLKIDTVDVRTDRDGALINALATSASFQWLDCNDEFATIVDDTLANFTAIENGEYAVEVSQNGCIDTTACVTISSVGVKESRSAQIARIIPNPNNGHFSVIMDHIPSEGLLLIYNSLGSVIYESILTESQGIYSEDISINQASGVYFLRIEMKDEVYFEKLIVR